MTQVHLVVSPCPRQKPGPQAEVGLAGLEQVRNCGHCLPIHFHTRSTLTQKETKQKLSRSQSFIDSVTPVDEDIAAVVHVMGHVGVTHAPPPVQVGAARAGRRINPFRP